MLDLDPFQRLGVWHNTSGKVV